jgi:glutaredoxin
MRVVNSTLKYHLNNGHPLERIKAYASGQQTMAAELILEHAEGADTDFLVYTGNFCGYCKALKRLLDGRSMSFTEYNFDEHTGLRKQIVAATGHRTVPVVFDIRENEPVFIGGFDETNRYLK